MSILVLGVGLAACHPDPTGGTGTTRPTSTEATEPSRDIPALVPNGAPIEPAVIPVGQASNQSVAVAGVHRTYRLYIPASLPRHAGSPLLIALHGGLGSGRQFEQQTGFDGLAEANRFVVAYPDGTPNRPGSKGLVWNAGSCCSVAAQGRQNVNDVGFISALITQLEQRYAINKNMVFVTGHSNGAMLGERLACQLANQVAAIAVQSGTLVIDHCQPAQPVAVLEVHGTADQNVPINGGVGSNSLNQFDYPPPVNGLEKIAGRDQCPQTPTVSTDAVNPAVSFETWSPCTSGTVVEWAKVSGASHAWMGHPASSAAEAINGGPAYLGFDASAAAWSFLSAHGRS